MVWLVVVNCPPLPFITAHRQLYYDLLTGTCRYQFPNINLLQNKKSNFIQPPRTKVGWFLFTFSLSDLHHVAGTWKCTQSTCHIYEGPLYTWGRMEGRPRTLINWANMIAQFSNPVQGLLHQDQSEHSLVPCGIQGGTMLAPNHRGRLEETGTNFFSIRTLSMGLIGLVCWIMNISTVGP